jgi:hypothetical protein
LWGDFKSLVYSSPVDDVETLRKWIVAGLQTIRNMPGIWDCLQVAKRCLAEACICIQGGGEHMEHYCKVMWRAECHRQTSETMRFWTYVDINYFYYLHMKN